MKKILILLGAIAVLVVLGGVYQNRATDGELKIGVIGGFSGDAAIYGQALQRGFDLAAGEINARGGIKGQKVTLIYEDTKCSGKDAAAAVQKLISVDKIKFIAGGTCSDEILSAAPITEAQQTILFVNIPSSPLISQAGDYIFRNSASDNNLGKEIAALIRSKHRKLGFISDNTSFNTSLEGVITQHFQAAGGFVVSEQTLPGSNDYRSVLVKLKQNNPEAIFLNMQTGAPAARIAKQARELGMTQPFYTAYFSGSEFVQSGPAVEGAMVFDLPNLSTATGNQKARDFLERFKQTYGFDPEYSYYSGATYDTVHLLAQMIPETGLDTKAMQNYLYQLPTFDGVLGSYSFDETGDLEGIHFTASQVKGGKLERVK